MKKRVTNKELGDMIGKSEQTIKGWKSKFPELLEIARLGALCKVNGLDKERIIKLVELQDVIQSKK